MNWTFDVQPLKIRPILWIETPDNRFPVVERNIAEELISHLHRFESLKNRM
jgi:hypothetical protein